MLKKRVCIIGDLYKTYSIGNQGGGETQLLLLAKTLIKIGFEVIIVDARVVKRIITSEGIIFLPISNKKKNSLIEKITKKSIPLFKILLQLNCDYYFSSIMGFRQFIPLIVSKKNKSKFYYWIAADLELESIWSRYRFWYKNQLNASKLYSILLCEFFFPLVLKYADIVFAQHINQLKKLNFRRSYVLQNVVHCPEIKTDKSDYFIWVGSIDFIKGFPVLENIVKDLNNIKFKIVGRIRDDTCLPILNRIIRNNNVEYLGYIEKNDDVLALISGAKALISTAEKEGFPITFIEAWALNTPVISLYVDPGDVINKNQLGFCAKGDYNSFVNYIKSFSAAINSNDITKFYEENFSLTKFEQELNKYFKQ